MYIDVCRCNIFINMWILYLYIIWSYNVHDALSCNFCHACMLLHRKTKDKYFKVFEMAT